ncbi:MAG: single-stranded DNA-binding protein [Patescibacteria group bacterium]|nr:single-stranded DNA-binding protein [Patescibacteria group bacterium]
MNLNKIFLIGRLTRDPELKTLPSGNQVANFGLATDIFYTDKSGQKQQQAEFHNIVLFGRLAEIASQYLTKGSLAFLEGRVKTRSWEDSSGNKKYRTEIIGERLQLGPKSASQATSAPQQPSQQPKQATKDIKSEDIPVIEENEGEIDVSQIPF